MERLLLLLLLLLLLQLYVQAFPIRKTDKIKQAKYKKCLNCGHLSSKQTHLYGLCKLLKWVFLSCLLFKIIFIYFYFFIPALFFKKKGYINFVPKSVRRPSVCLSVCASVRHVSCKCISS